jgi:hypothetical protein
MPWGTIAQIAISIAVNGIQEIQKDTGKSFAECVADWINHNTKGQPNSPALAPEAAK